MLQLVQHPARNPNRNFHPNNVSPFLLMKVFPVALKQILPQLMENLFRKKKPKILNEIENKTNRKPPKIPGREYCVTQISLFFPQ